MVHYYEATYIKSEVVGYSKISFINSTSGCITRYSGSKELQELDTLAQKNLKIVRRNAPVIKRINWMKYLIMGIFLPSFCQNLSVFIINIYKCNKKWCFYVPVGLKKI